MAQETNGRNSAVAFARIAAMLLIMICHTYNKWIIGTLTTVGISVFLLISGYLYGTRDISDPFTFLKKRYMTITFPAVVFVLAMAVYYWFHARNDLIIPMVILFIFNLQGMNKLFSRIPSIEMGPGVLHLWFLTALMACYLLMIGVKKIEKKHPVSRRTCRIMLIVSTLIAFLGGLPEYKIRFNLIQIFFFGYWYAQQKTEMTLKKLVAWVMMMLTTAVPMWILLKKMPDSGLYIGAGYIWRNLLGICIFFFFLYLQQRFPQTMDGLGNNRVVFHIDRLSYYIFIVHYIFSSGPFCVFTLPVAFPLQMLIFAAVTLLCAEILMALCKPVIRMVTQKKTA